MALDYVLASLPSVIFGIIIWVEYATDAPLFEVAHQNSGPDKVWQVGQFYGRKSFRKVIGDVTIWPKLHVHRIQFRRQRDDPISGEVERSEGEEKSQDEPSEATTTANAVTAKG